MAKFTIKVTATLNGKPCKNPKVEFLQGESFLYPCKIKNGEIEFEIKPGINPNVCIEGYIKCDDECLNCPPQYFKKCLCNDVTLLEACQKCVDGFIVDTCTPAQIAAGLICTTDGCKCPPSTPLTDPNTGQCVQCITGTKDGCKICVAGHWEDIVCPTGERCENGVCNCPAGYIRDTFTGACIVKPECTDDSACGPCEICVSGNCEPVVCPDKHKCVNGECIYWPCTDASCNNGADCGEECGCLDGVCTPCYMLNCAENTSCTSALGCECKGENCIPISNCGQPCDGFTPCTEPGCTCYNGTCVNCANFPCTTESGGCDSFYNCQCTDGNCGGGTSGEGCKDKLEIKQLCGNNDNDCKLVAELTTKGCKCDPIRFETINTDICLPSPIIDNTVTNLGLEVKLYKGNVLYSDFTNLTIGDNEFISGNIKTVVTHYDVNNNILTSVDVAAIADKAISGNKVEGKIIVSGGTHYKKSYTTIELGKTVTKGTLVKVQLYAKNIEIENNDCINYEDELIATYELNFRTVSDMLDTCARNTLVYAQIKQIQQVVDNVSTKRPLFIWSKGITDFKSTAYKNDKVYDQSGWFRKFYGVKSGGVWKDTISKYTEPDELWNNYNYQVKVDCGCATVANKNKVLFCCLPEFDYEFTKCNKKLVIEPFNVCNVNGKIDSFAPIYCQTNYYVRLILKDGGERNVLIPFDTNTRTVKFEYEELNDESIVSAEIFQSYQGGLLTPRECPKSLVIPSVAELNIDIQKDCNAVRPVTGEKVLYVNVNQLSGGIKIRKIEFYRKLDGSASLVNLAAGIYDSAEDISNTSSYNTRIPKSILSPTLSVVVRAYLTNGCTKEVTLDKCPVKVSYSPSPAISTLSCDNGVGGAISSITDGYDLTQPINFSIEGENLPQPIENTSGDFANLSAGSYILTASQGGLTASTSVLVLDLAKPTVSLSPSTVCPGQTATLSIGATPGTTFSITGPNGLSLANIVVPNSGVYNLQNLALAGNYTVQLTGDSTNSYCPQFTEVKSLSNNGQALNPIIEIQPGSFCVGQPVPFRIRDNGAGATYTLSSNGSGSLPLSLQASDTTYNGVFIPNAVSGLIRITGVADTCNTTTLPQITVAAVAGPVVFSAVSSCADDNSNTVTVTTSGATGVTVDGIAATETFVGSGVYERTNITNISNAEVVVSNGACTVVQNVVLGDCTCPQGEVFITSTGDTCGQGGATVQFNGDSLGISGSWLYVFQQMSGADYVDLDGELYFPVTPLSPAPSVVVNTVVGQAYTIRLKVKNPLNNCEYFSSPVSFTAVQPPIGSTITPSIQLPVLTGVPISFSTQAGYFSYVWSGDVAGTTNTSTPKIFNTPGTYQATVTVCSAVGCCEVISLNFDVEQACTPAILFGSPSSGLCSDITIAATGGNGAKTYTVSGTFINVVSTAVPGSNIITIPTAIVPAGESDTLTLLVTDSNGCTAEKEIIYSRCSCICESTTCAASSKVSTTLSTPTGTTVSKTIGYFLTGTKFNWLVDAVGGSNSVKAVMKRDGNIIFDTDWITRSSTACGLTGCNAGIDYLGDDPSASVTVVGGTTPTGLTDALGAFACDTLSRTLSIPSGLGVGFFKGIGANQITLVADGEIVIEITRGTCVGSGGSPQAYFEVSCD